MNTDRVAELVGASQRQLEYWANRGYFGPEAQGRGSGTRRTWTPRQCEIAWAVARSADIGTADHRIGARDTHALVADAVTVRPVNVEGEWLVVTTNGAWRRYDLVSLAVAETVDAARVIRLRSFTVGALTNDNRETA